VLVLTSTITCPNCGFEKQEPMPENACVHFYECTHCHQLLRPQPGKCCVFCSYGSTPCPPRQPREAVHPLNLDALSGRELDMAVARHVFRRVVEERVNARTKEKYAVYRVSGHGWVQVPEYSRNLSASFEVESKLEDLGWRRHVPPAGLLLGASGVKLVHRDGRRVEASGPFQTALCRAAVKATAP
jgi:hypothetical protein